MSFRFIAAVNHLAQADEQLSNGRITIAQHAALRESALIRALKELAAQCGVDLVLPLQINSVGEISIVAKPETGQSAHRMGSFGQAFVDHLNDFSPRTNLKPGTKLMPNNGRCHMSHMDVQKMVVAHFKTLSSTRS
ncbi:MAG: hypothetical protein IPN53_22330 [Comamonadaceae bacterium]|nr:hypothetical protein [Comamonadaceae bacterium]